MKFLVFLLLFLFPFASFAYEPTQTHAGLTEQVVEFYNINTSSKISASQKDLVIKGAMEEDDPSARALNHFYDPVRNIGIEGGRTAKTWALDDLEANDFSWDEAITAYARGDIDTAFVALGHNIHLIEDMGVPDHTRNDQHLPFLDEDMGGHSPYEDWAMENKNRQTMRGVAQGFASEGAVPKIFSQFGDYFDFLANYSNKNFFSRDTIGSSIYSQPVVIKNDGKYFYGIDGLSNSEVRLFGTFDKKDGTQFFALNNDRDFSILSSYFDRLSRQIIPSGAGIIELFFKEGEQARVAYQLEFREQQDAEARASAELARALSQKGFVGRIWSGMVFLAQDTIWKPVNGYVIRPAGNTLASAARWSNQEFRIVTDTASFAAVATVGAAKNAAVATGEWTAQKTSQALVIVQRAIDDTLNAPIDPQGQPAGVVYIIDDTPPSSPENQEASAATFAAAKIAAEPSISVASAVTSVPRLVFLGNLSPGFGGGAAIIAATQPPDSTEETIEISQEDTPEVVPEVPTAPALLSAPALMVPQCAYSFAADGCLLVTTAVRFEWDEVAGALHYAVNKNGIYATTTSIALDLIVPDFSDYTFEVAAVGVGGQTSATSTKTISVATIPLAINEIAWMGTVASPSDEWFEIKNNTAYMIDLAQWALNAKDGTPYVKLAGTIAPRAYIIFERTDNTAVADVAAHQIYTGALGNSGEQLNLAYASTTLDQTPDISDDDTWAGGFNSTMTKKTMERYASKESGADPTNWGTNLGYIKNGTDVAGNPINGTPSAQNSLSMLINKGQDITSDFTVTADEERYVVPDTLWIEASTTLTIEPGVTISFLRDSQRRNGYVFAQGEVDARGTAEDPITFDSFLGNQAGGFWFANGTGTSTFEYANFENTGDIGLDATNLEIRNANFAHTDGGVNLYGNSTATIENTTFASTTDDVIGVYGGSSLLVASTTIDGALGDGIGVYDGTLAIASSTIKNVSGDGIGLYDATSTISNVVIENGGRDGIGVYGGTSSISNTTVLGFDNGSGIVVLEPEETITITGGEVFGNDVGISMDEGSAILDGVSVHDNTTQDTIIFPVEEPAEEEPVEESPEEPEE